MYKNLVHKALLLLIHAVSICMGVVCVSLTPGHSLAIEKYDTVFSQSNRSSRKFYTEVPNFNSSRKYAYLLDSVRLRQATVFHIKMKGTIICPCQPTSKFENYV